MKTKRESGEYSWHNMPYGYKWNEDKTTIIPSEPYAGYVKDIFRWILEGVSRNQIRKRLEEQNIPSGFTVSGRGGRNKWKIGSIDTILRNPAYVGDKALGKHLCALYKGVKDKRVYNPNEWVVFHDDHEPLVSRIDFEKVQKILRENADAVREKVKASREEREKLVDLLPGKIFCHDCGAREEFLRKKESQKKYYFGLYQCTTYSHSYCKECQPHSKRQTVLYRQIMDAIRVQVQVAVDYEKLLSRHRLSDAARAKKEKMNAEIKSLTMRMRSINNKRAKLYEDYAEGVLNEEEYSFAKASYDAARDKLNRELDEAVARKETFMEIISPDNKWISMMKTAEGMSELTKEMADTLIERVEVCNVGGFVLTMKYQDIYQMTNDYIAEIGAKEE